MPMGPNSAPRLVPKPLISIHIVGVVLDNILYGKVSTLPLPSPTVQLKNDVGEENNMTKLTRKQIYLNAMHISVVLRGYLGLFIWGIPISCAQILMHFTPIIHYLNNSLNNSIQIYLKVTELIIEPHDKKKPKTWSMR